MRRCDRIMDAVVASLVAVGGTLAGATLTFAFSLVMARRSQSIARAERLHQELQAACAAFAAAANQMRRSANDRWYRQHEGADRDVQLAAGDAFYSARTSRSGADHAVGRALAIRCRHPSGDLGS